jgi:hypothetical protein
MNATPVTNDLEKKAFQLIVAKAYFRSSATLPATHAMTQAASATPGHPFNASPRSESCTTMNAGKARAGISATNASETARRDPDQRTAMKAPSAKASAGMRMLGNSLE